MDVMDEALPDFWRKLNEHHVKFIMAMIRKILLPCPLSRRYPLRLY